jgi:hypothetical protein
MLWPWLGGYSAWKTDLPLKRPRVISLLPNPEGKCARSSHPFSFDRAFPALPKRQSQVIVSGVVLSAVAGSLLAA